MSEKSPSKDEALEALDFIVNVLKEHEKDLDKLVSELGSVAGQLADSGELTNKVKKIEDKINGLQDNVGNLLKSLSNSSKEQKAFSAPIVKPSAQSEIASPPVSSGMPVVLKCRQWDDFQSLAAQAQTVSFILKDSEKTLEVDALKNNQVISFVGEMPKLSFLLKMFLSRQLAVSETHVLEGSMALG